MRHDPSLFCINHCETGSKSEGSSLKLKIESRKPMVHG